MSVPTLDPIPGDEPQRPYVPNTQKVAELSLRTVALGSALGIIFAASSVYLALKAGLTVSASIPVAVMSITIFRAFGRATILENNIVQTAGSAGESLAAGIAFTLPALLLMGYELDPWRVTLVALLGGLLGVLMMVPLRHGLIVREHGKLMYPEGKACAEVLTAGEQGGAHAKTVFAGFGIAAAYKFLSSGLRLWPGELGRTLSFYKGASVAAELSPELLGVGYIIGPRIGGTMLAGGVLSYLVLMPMIALFGGQLATKLFPARKLISTMGPDELRSSFVLYIGAGAVATGGLIAMARAFPTIATAFVSGLRTLRATHRSGTSVGTVPRTARDLSMNLVIVGSLGLIAAAWLIPSLGLNLATAALIGLFSFVFVTVSSRITGQIGSSSNPISGMTVATLLLTCLLFLSVGWIGPHYRIMALTTAAIVCVAAANAGATSQDLKTGYLVGATPRSQQLALLVGVATSGVVIGLTLTLLNNAYTTVLPEEYPGERVETLSTTRQPGPDQHMYRVGYVTESGRAIPPGRYLVDDGGSVRFVIDPGIGGRYATIRPRTDELTEEVRRGPDGENYHVGVVHHATQDLPQGRYLANEQRQIYYRLEGGHEVPVAGKSSPKLAAPKAQVFALMIDGILTHKLPWGLVLMGVMVALAMELCGISSLPFAVGLYLPLATSVPIMAGGTMRWLADRSNTRRALDGDAAQDNAERSPGTLLSSGYIAGGAIAGLVIAAITGAGLSERMDRSQWLGSLAQSPVPALLCFASLCGTLLWVSVRRLDAQSGGKTSSSVRGHGL